ncbi:MAG: hypothetical protein M3M94_03575 [Actinomycetota bacterium]|nr:hypothetical protein [Actinomycetota bacterium]
MRSRHHMHQQVLGIGEPPRGPFRSNSSTRSLQRSGVTGTTSSALAVSDIVASSQR